MTTQRVGILGVALYLPPEVRHNDFWSPEVVDAWMRERPAPLPASTFAGLGPGAQRVMEALKLQARDPFQGAVERRVLPASMSVFDMEEPAARQAIERAGIAREAIDLVLTNTIVPSVQLSNPACTLHERLGLSRACLSMHTDVATHAFMMQLTLAEAMIRAGRARYALLVQSCACSRLVAPSDVISPYFGDGATAVVVGPVASSRGIEAVSSFTDGRFPQTLVAGVPGGNWYDDGRTTLYIADPAATQRVFLETADACKESVDAVLAESGRRADEITYLCIHQGAAWLRRVVQDYLGMSGARSIETFQETGYLFAATMPANLAVAEARGELREGDVVLLVGGGPGMTYGATLLTWGT
ncbi:MAG: 3-oxoacyl-ACP synthase III family protein [Kofleriaceae bacterium]|nr:3-oxoacyl-ACP synthase III family protein [Kofleriaceae bacterium]